MYLDEMFVSIQGEGSETGQLCTFVRLFGCPFRCSYCDTKQDPINKKRIHAEGIVRGVKAFKVKNVCITGGEPLIYKEELMPIVWELQHSGYNVSIETSGCIEIDYEPYLRSYKYIMDIKCPSSKMSTKNVYDNLLKLQANDDLIFVIKDREDYDFMKRVLMKYSTSAKIFISPMFEDNKPVIASDIVDWMIEDMLQYKVQIQLHKILQVR